MITVVTWIWGHKYSADYVVKLRNGVRRFMKTEHRFVCVTDGDPIPDIDCVPLLEGSWFRELLEDKGCFARLQLFNPQFQERLGGETFLQLDLDNVVTGSLDHLLDYQSLFPYSILQGVNSANPCPYNGSVQLLRKGYASHVWSSFSLEKARKVPFHSFPDDQGWIAATLPAAHGLGPRSGVYAFEKPGWPRGYNLPKNAAVVCFPGSRDPSQFMKLGWVRDNWSITEDASV